MRVGSTWSSLGLTQTSVPLKRPSQRLSERVETLMRDEVKEYVTTIVVERELTTTQGRFRGSASVELMSLANNGRRSPRKLLRAVVARLLGRKPGFGRTTRCQRATPLCA